jgi:hypothetical protein
MRPQASKRHRALRKKRDPFALPAKSRKAGPFKKRKPKYKKPVEEEE